MAGLQFGVPRKPTPKGHPLTNIHTHTPIVVVVVVVVFVSSRALPGFDSSKCLGRCWWCAYRADRCRLLRDHINLGNRSRHSCASVIKGYEIRQSYPMAELFRNQKKCKGTKGTKCLSLFCFKKIDAGMVPTLCAP